MISLTICTRCPVSTSILAIRSRILGGVASPAATASRLSVSARSPTVVSGVRSSCDRLSMNSARICWRRRSSLTSARASHAPPELERRTRTTRAGPSAPRRRTSPDANPCACAVRAIRSICGSRNTSSRSSPSSVPGGRSTSACAVPLADTTSRRGSSSRIATSTRSATRWRSWTWSASSRSSRATLSRSASTPKTGSPSVPTPVSSRTLRSVISARRPPMMATPNPIAAAIAMMGQGSTARASHMPRDAAPPRQRRRTEAAGRRSLLSSSERHGRVSRSHSDAG